MKVHRQKVFDQAHTGPQTTSNIAVNQQLKISALLRSMIYLDCLFSTECPGPIGQSVMEGIINPSTELLYVTYFSISNTELQVMKDLE